jgi:hypothetical protein
MANSLMSNVSHCNKSMVPAYFDCQATRSTKLHHDSHMLEYFETYQQLGKALSSVTIACCAVVFLISLYCKFYSQWAEQIILSKALFVFGFGVCLLTSFNDDQCTLQTSVATLSLILGDILWTCVLLVKLVYTAKRPFEQASLLTGIIGNWVIVVAICSGYAVGVYFALSFGVTDESAGAGYLQSVPICLVPRLFAQKFRNTGLKTPFNQYLFFFLYIPYCLVFIVNIVGLVYIRKRFSSQKFQGNASFSARLKVLRTIKQYLASYFLYTFFLILIYLIPFNVHSCSPEKSIYRSSNHNKNDVINNENQEFIVQFPPACLSWMGYVCNLHEEGPGAQNPNGIFYVLQILFFILFCLRGVPDLIVFFFLNKNRIIQLIRGREYVAYVPRWFS